MRQNKEKRQNKNTSVQTQKTVPSELKKNKKMRELSMSLEKRNVSNS